MFIDNNGQVNNIFIFKKYFYLNNLDLAYWL